MMPFYLEVSINKQESRNFQVPKKFLQMWGQSPKAAIEYWKTCFSKNTITRAALMDNSGELGLLFLNGQDFTP